MQDRKNRIQLWVARQGAIPPAIQAQWHAWLDPDEQQRWQRYARQEDRLGFLLGKALTRAVLAQWLDQAPQQVAFSRDSWGKPHLAGTSAAAGLHFNLSHTPGMAVLAVSAGPVVGVDVESVQRSVEALALARRYFSALEVRMLEGLQGAALQECFMAIWTLKEAWLKAKGLGLRLPLDAFSMDPSSQPPGLHFHALPDESPEAWQLRCYQQAEYRIALALQCRTLALEPELHHWQPASA